MYIYININEVNAFSHISLPCGQSSTWRPLSAQKHASGAKKDLMDVVATQNTLFESNIQIFGGFLKWGYLQIIYFYWIFH